MSPIPQCSEKRCLFSVYYSTISRHQRRSEDIFQPRLAGVVQCHAKQIRLYARYPSKTARKTISLSPPRNFPPRHQVSSRAQDLSNVPRAAHLSTKQKVLQRLQTRDDVRKVQEDSCPMQSVIKSINVRLPWRKARLSRPLLFLLPPTVFALFLRRFVRFTRFFLLLTSPHTHTALLLHSSGCHPLLPHPAPHPSAPPSVIRAASWPQCLWALPFPPPIKLRSCLLCLLCAQLAPSESNASTSAPRSELSRAQKQRRAVAKA